MDERAFQFRVGVVMLAAMVITVILVMLFGNLPTLWSKEYTIFLQFSEAPGIRHGTPVRKSGVRIGRVTGVQLQPDGVLVTAMLDAEFPIDRNETCFIRSASLLGDAELEFALRDNTRAHTVIADGEFINETKVESDPMADWTELKTDLSGAARAITDAGDRVAMLSNDFGTAARSFDQLSRNMTQLIDENEEGVRTANQNLNELINRLNRVTRPIDRMLDDPDFEDQVEAMFEAAPIVLQDTLRIVSNIEAVTADMKTMTGAARKVAPEMIATINNSADQLDELLTQLVHLSRKLNDPKGNVGKFVGSSDLYDKINRTATTIDELVWQLRPIVSDVRVFTDKIARDPRQLGIKGALDKRQTGTKHLNAMPAAPGKSGMPAGPVYVLPQMGVGETPGFELR